MKTQQELLRQIEEALRRYANPEIQNQHNYKSMMNVDDTVVAREALPVIDELVPLGNLSDGACVTSEHFKPCPFCGEKIIYLTTGKDGCINCPNCLVRMPNECNDHLELVDAWNTRNHTRAIEKIEALDALHGCVRRGDVLAILKGE